ncbi:MAG: hypothetical protein PHX08_23035, partial [Lachnospiraceae bacterium]|nr:hypothetical protein [Lachnospiraceae bacterium]
DDFKVIESHIIPRNLKVVTMPLFLEGPMHLLKLPYAQKQKLEMYEKLKHTGLYDQKLKMYKVNDSLAETSFEVGRAKAFSPGWLENESIWLHMEYKYLLELLKSGMYQAFFEDFKHACIPFMEYQVYGRSLLENSSFIVSSANQNEKIHGKGFVARLSGSTAEFLQMWQIMMFGKNPFKEDNGTLKCSLEPTLPEYLIPTNLIVEATFIGTTKVSYHLDVKREIIPGQYNINQMQIKYRSGKTNCVSGNYLENNMAVSLRNNEIQEVHVFITGNS